MCRLQTWLSSRHKPSVVARSTSPVTTHTSHGPSSALNLNFPSAGTARRRELQWHARHAMYRGQAKRSLGGEERRHDRREGSELLGARRVPTTGAATAVQLHEIDDMNAPPAVFNAPVPGTSMASPQIPAASLTTKAWLLPELSK